MRDVTALTDKDLLAIPADWPERLFTCDLAEAKAQYRKLAMLWHPDRNPGLGQKVFAHIQVLFKAAEDRILMGTWRENGLLKQRDKNGTEFNFRYRRAYPFELGHVYVGDSAVAWSLEIQYEDLARNALNVISHFNYHDDTMRKEHTRHLPSILSVVKLADKIIVVMRKTPDQFLLRDVLEHFGGALDPKHVAWIISSLLNINCYLNFTGIVHNAISLDTYFVSPENHSGALLGGWWYAAQTGQRLHALPTRTLHYGPADLPVEKRADRKTDSSLIRVTGRELFGDASGSKLITNKTVPKAITEWLRGIGSRDAYGEYSHWYNKVLQDAFGPRRFVRMAVTASDIYKEN